jgi:ketosteroid isomerase-like protein
MDRNKDLVATYFTDMSAKGMQQALREHGTDDFSWWICGIGDMTPHIPRLSAAFDKHFDERRMVINPIRMISEGDEVAVEAVSDSTFRNGNKYQNTICYWITVSGSKIVHVREYLDNVYGAQAIAPILADVFGEAS